MSLQNHSVGVRAHFWEPLSLFCSELPKTIPVPRGFSSSRPWPHSLSFQHFGGSPITKSADLHAARAFNVVYLSFRSVMASQSQVAGRA